MNFTVYEQSSGRITSFGFCPDGMENLQGEHVIVGESYDNQYYYISNGNAVLFPEKPHSNAVWNWNNLAWEIPEDPIVDLEVLEIEARQKRDRLLAASDWTQMPDAPLTETYKTQWQLYRQALRDITSQDQFPKNILWPEMPQKG